MNKSVYYKVLPADSWQVWIVGLFLAGMWGLCVGIRPARAGINKPTRETGKAITDVNKVYTHKMEINYRIKNIKRQDIKRVELWYARGKSGPWQLYGFDKDKTSPVEFEVPFEGYWRFLVVAVDRWGRCSLNADKPYKALKNGGLYTGSIPVGTAAHVGLWVSSPAVSAGKNKADVKVLRKADASSAGKTRRITADTTNKNRPKTLAKVPKHAKKGIKTAKKIDVYYAGKDIGKSAKQVNYQAPPPNKPTNEQANKQAKEQTKGEPGERDGRAKKQQAGEYLRRGNFYFARKEWAQAKQAYKKAIALDAKCIDAHLFLARTLYKQNQYDEAQKQFEVCLRENPALRNAVRYDIAQIQISAGQDKMALATLNQLVKDDPGDYQAWLVLGDTANKLKKGEMALKAWRKAASSKLPVIARIARQRLLEYNP